MFCGYLRQSTSVDVLFGPFLDSADGNTEKGALTITQPDIRLKKNAANWGQKNAAQTLTYEEGGYYELTLDATDTNTLGVLTVAAHKTGALPVRQTYLVISAAAYDVMFGTLPAGVVAMGTAQAGAAGSITLAASTAFADNVPNVIVHIYAGTGAGQSRVGAGYTSATKVLAVSPSWTVTPDNTSQYICFVAPPAPTAAGVIPKVDTQYINGALVQGAGTSGDKWRG